MMSELDQLWYRLLGAWHRRLGRSLDACVRRASRRHWERQLTWRKRHLN